MTVESWLVVCDAAEAGTAGGDESAAGAGWRGADPERVQFSAREVKPESHHLAADAGQIGGRRPGDTRARAVGSNRNAIGFREPFDGPALFVQHLDAQLALGRVDVHEQVPAGETDRPRGQ